MTVLSEGAEGKVAVCGNCDDVHLAWGAVSLRLSKQDFLALAALSLRAAAHPALSVAREARSLLSSIQSQHH